MERYRVLYEEEGYIVNKTAEKILDYLPKNGNPLSGGQIRAELSLSKTDFNDAKAQLKSAGVIECGRGRGGTVRRIIGAKLPKVTPRATPQERAQFAREARQTLYKENKKHDKIRNAVFDWATKEFPEAETIETQLWNNNEVYIYVWNEGEAKTYLVWVDGENISPIKDVS